MPLPQIVIDWNAADDAANAATRECIALIEGGHKPTDDQFEKLMRLRIEASELMHKMLAALRSGEV